MGRTYLMSVVVVLAVALSAFADTTPLAASAEWQAISMDNLLVESGTALDMSDAIPFVKPCGVKGRIIVNSAGKLAFANEPNTAVRFNGFVCTPHRLFYYPGYWSSLTEPEWKMAIEAYADGIVRQGFNMVRLHGMDISLIYGGDYSIYPIPTTVATIPFRTDAVELFHYFIYCLKQRGVYVTIDLMMSGAGYTSARTWDTDNPDVQTGDFRQMMYSDSVRRQNWEAGVTKLLTMVNPYTSTALKDDPILTFVVYNNEQFFTWAEKYCTALDSEWKSWVAEQYPTEAELCEAWPTESLIDWTLVDDFSSGLTDWTVYSYRSTVDTLTNPLSAGPSSSVARLQMTQTRKYKYAEIVLDQSLSYDDTNQMRIVFDLGYLFDIYCSYAGNWGQKFALLDSNGTEVFAAGHLGTLSAYPTLTNIFRVQTASSDMRSTPPVGQATDTWYHYVVTLSSTETTVDVYSWISDDPDDYISETPVWTTSVEALSSGSYTIQFYNNFTHTYVDPDVNSRDTMYVDNVYTFEGTAYDNIPSLNATTAGSYTAIGNDMTSFIAEIEDELNYFYADTLSNIGYTGLATNFNNSHTFNRIPAMAEFDLVAFNPYIAHPSGDSVNQNSSLTPNIAGWTALWWFLDNPFVVTEYNHAFWNPFRHEQGIYMGSLAALQGWSGINMHCETAFPLHMAIETFRNQDDPIARAAAVFAAFAYGRGDVQPASTSVAFLANDDDSWGRGLTTTANSIYGLRNLSLICRTGTRYDGASSTTASPAMEISHLDGTVRSLLGVPQTGGSAQTIDSLVSIMRSNGILSTSNLTDPSANIFQSETGEITAYGNTGVMKVITSSLEGLTVKTDTQVDGDKLVVKSCSVPASIAAISLNADETLEESRRILVLIGTDALNTGMTFTDSTHVTVVDNGTLPVLMRTGQFELEIENSAITRPAVYALNMDGTRKDRVFAEVSNGKILVTIDTENLDHGPTPFFEIIQRGTNWTLVDDFSGSLTTNWSVYSNLSTVDTLTNPLSMGPNSSVARLDMTQTVTGKYADIVLDQSLNYNGKGTLNIAFDMGYLFDTNCSYAGNWAQNFALLDSNGDQVMFAGHLGTLAAYPLYTNVFRVKTATTDVHSDPPVGQPTDTWYHYVVSLSPTETTVSVYTWISDDPDDYELISPVWTTSVEALGSGSYSMQFYNSHTHALADNDVNSRDTMYVDNVYTAKISAWQRIDNFVEDLSNNWTVSSNSSTVDVLTNPLSTGPSGSVARLEMTQTVTGKYADIVFNQPVNYNGAGTLNIAFDLGYLFDTSCAFAGNWGQKFALLDSNGDEVLSVGHLGTLSSYPTLTNVFRVKTDSYDMFSTPPVGQASGTWYHYAVSITPTATTVNIYSWISDDPDDYLSETPVSTTTVEAISSGSYSIQFYNNFTHTSADPDVNSRDTMYVDNVHMTKVSSWTLIDDFSDDFSDWTVYSAYSTVDIISNPFLVGPIGSVARLDMTQMEYNKYAEIIHSQLLSYNGTSTMELAFDLGYLWDSEAAYGGNYFQGIALLDSSVNLDALIGHKGYLPSDPTNSENFRARTTSQVYSTPPVGQANRTWYHYVVSMSSTETVVSVYSWVSSDPDDYASETPVWTVSLEAMAADSYSLSFANSNLHTSPDAYDSSRDTMYLDNVYKK